MPQIRTIQKVPPNTSKDGTIHIAGSRVGLESIIHEFKNGATAEQIHGDFPSVLLRDVYAVITYYLDNKRDVENYLRLTRSRELTARRYIEARVDTTALRSKLRSKRMAPVR